MEILSTRFGKSVIFSVFAMASLGGRLYTGYAMAKEQMSSSKTCMITISPLKSTIDDQISAMLSLTSKAMDRVTETVNFSASPQFSLLLGVRE